MTSELEKKVNNAVIDMAVNKEALFQTDWKKKLEDYFKVKLD